MRIETDNIDSKVASLKAKMQEYSTIIADKSVDDNLKKAYLLYMEDTVNQLKCLRESGNREKEVEEKKTKKKHLTEEKKRRRRKSFGMKILGLSLVR